MRANNLSRLQYILKWHLEEVERCKISILGEGGWVLSKMVIAMMEWFKAHLPQLLEAFMSERASPTRVCSYRS